MTMARKYFALQEDFLKAARQSKVNEIFFTMRTETRGEGSELYRWAYLKLTALTEGAQVFLCYNVAVARSRELKEDLEVLNNEIARIKEETIKTVQKELPSTFLIEGEIQP